jgi:transposase
MYNSGKSAQSIADDEGLTRHAIFGIVRRYRHQVSAKDNKRSGRPQILTERDKSHIKMLIDRDAFIQYYEIIRKCGLSCHRSTIRRWLLKEGIQHKHALRRPFLSQENAQIRKNWCDRYRHEDESFWYSWWFSDECTIDRTDGDYTKWSFYKAVRLNPYISKAYSDITTGRETL